jgi:NAD(P)-dependent dehydrogenase (short-subunit alcohol dehydrogenase family)
MLTRDLAIELAPNKITINSIAPGAIEAPSKETLERSSETERTAGKYSARKARETRRCGRYRQLPCFRGFRLLYGDHDLCRRRLVV